MAAGGLHGRGAESVYKGKEQRVKKRATLLNVDVSQSLSWRVLRSSFTTARYLRDPPPYFFHTFIHLVLCLSENYFYASYSFLVKHMLH